MRIILTFIFCMTFAVSYAQVSLRLANKKYDRYHYLDAIKLYEDYLNANSKESDTQKTDKNGKNPRQEAIEKLAHSYRKINDSKNAEKWYAEVVGFSADPQNKFYYAQALAMNGNYADSKKWYAEYAKATKNDKIGMGFVKSYQDSVFKNFFADSSRYNIERVKFNSPQADFSPMYYKTGLVFCSSRLEGASKIPVKHTFNWNKTRFLDLYYTADATSNPSVLNAKLNSRYHEGPVTFFPTGDSIIFTRNNYYKGKYKTSKDKTNKLKIYFANTKNGDDGDWGNITEFPYNSDEYSVGHPTLTTDGRTMYFISDMPGGYGGTDIYMTTFQNGKWSKPINLGAEINTKGREMFPYIDKNNDLYFASDGHAGLGGLDIFVARNAKGKYISPKNIGYPINSKQDDFALIFDDDNDEGYFTSNREGGEGDDDIYKFKQKRCKFLAVVVHAQTKQIIKDAQVEVLEKETGLNFRPQKLNDSIYTFKARLATNYELKAYKRNFDDGKTQLLETTLLKCLKDGEDVSDTIRIPIAPRDPALADNNPDEPFGSPRKGKGNPEDPTGSTPIRPKPTYRYKNNPNIKVIEVTNVYYDFDKYNIRPDAARELDRVIQVMNEYPSLKIELSSHTDTRADNYYNIRLAQRRSRAAYHYLVTRGISPDRLVVNSFGENKLATDCPDDADCSEEDHQLNRRTEVIVLSY